MSQTKLTDTYKRRINYLRVSVTDRCNLRCLYCMPEEGVPLLGHGEILTFEEILRVVRISVGLGIRKVRVTGGEPLVRKNILGFIRELSSIEGIDDLSLTTNGLFLPQMAEGLAQSGLKRVNISLDTLRAETFKKITRRDGLDIVLKGIEAARKAGLGPIKINVVAMRGVNDTEILDFAQFAMDNDLAVRFIEFMPSRQDKWTEEQLVGADEILATLASRYELKDYAQSEATAGPGRMFTLPGSGRIGVISPMSNHFCSRCNRLRLTANGRLRGCLFSSTEADLKAPLRDGSSDKAIAKIVEAAVEEKPEGHDLNGEATSTGVKMSRVGG